MSSAIELIVDGFARLKDQQSLEDLRMHRRRLAADLKARSFDCRSSIVQIEQDIAAIEAGLQTLSGPVGGNGASEETGEKGEGNLFGCRIDFIGEVSPEPMIVPQKIPCNEF